LIQAANLKKKTFYQNKNTEYLCFGGTGEKK
jgi:hypothetical protein